MFEHLQETVHTWLIPSRRNDFHPHLLAERGLLILFALILGAEAFLVSNVVSTEAGAPVLAQLGGNSLAAAIRSSGTSTSLPSGITYLSNYLLADVILPLASLATQSAAGPIAFFVLVSTAALLMGLLALTLSVRRRQFQPIGYVAGGTMLLFAATFLFFDTQYLFPGEVATLQMAGAAASRYTTRVAAAPSSAASTTAMGKIDLFTGVKTAIITK